MRRPNMMRSARNASHARTPTRPVVTAEVGMNPMPEEKSIFQKTVEFSDASRCFNHSAPKVPGPVPKTGAVENVLLATK